jgi:hypothetical protein
VVRAGVLRGGARGKLVSSELEAQLEASLAIVRSADLPSEAQLIAVEAQLARLLREGPPRRQGIQPNAIAQKEK